MTADSPSYPERHRALAIRIAREFGLQHEIIKTSELENPEYRANPANRCYFCKHELYTHLSRIATQRHAVVVDGNNADDRGDYRPGRQAAREFGVRSPLDEVDLTKDEIRELSHRAGLPTWDEPASACLSSRIPYHTEVTDEKLRTVLWQWRGRSINRDLLETLTELRADLDSELGGALADLLDRNELRMTRRRVDRLLRTGKYPQPSGDWPAVPWPPF